MGLAIKVNPRIHEFTLDANGAAKIFRRRFKYSDFSAAATTGNNDTIIFPGGVRIASAWMSLITAFSGGSVGSCTISMGTTGSAATYLGATNVFTGATAGGAVTIAAGAGLGAFAGANATPNALGTVRVACVTSVANTSALTAGVIDVFLTLQAVDTRTT